MGAALVETLYILDKPTIGLHPKDTSALLDLIKRLRNAGNTVVVVEHDTQAIRSADHIVELGPASGEQGGKVVFEGPPNDSRARIPQPDGIYQGALSARHLRPTAG
ncbi:MAG: hypothetical protein Ct9H300mP15_01170 [Gemmatimonadota bacterium]|nr:MAG: hypothetical protein Ct9H300mP15_01170 [Gemmatimonadota bacterium]